MAEVTTTRAAFPVAARRLLTNHRGTGVPGALKIERYASRVGSAGIHVGGTPAASTRFLKEVTTMNTRGLTNRIARATSRAYRPILRAGLGFSGVPELSCRTGSAGGA